MNTLTIADLTFREAWRKRLFWVALGLGLAFIILFAIGFHYIIQEITTETSAARQGEAALNLLVSQISGVFLILGLFAVNVLIVMMSALTSAGAISGEISSHTIQSIATKPIRRWEIVAGKFLGQTLMLILYVVFMVTGLTLVIYFRTEYLPPNFPQALGLMILEGVVVLSISMFGGTILSTISNGVLIFMLYGIAFAGSWVEQIGAALNSDTAIQVGIISSLIMPSEALWRMTSDLLQPGVVRETGVPLIMLYSKPSQAMIIYALVYIVIFFSGAVYQFNRRDL